MKTLTIKETLAVNGAQDSFFNGVMFGVVAGGLFGSYASLRLITKHPIIAVFPQAVENTVALGVVCGACLGGVLGGVTAILLDDID